MSEDMDYLAEVAEQRDFLGDKLARSGRKRGVLAPHLIGPARGSVAAVLRASHGTGTRVNKITLPTVTMPDLDAEEAAQWP